MAPDRNRRKNRLSTKSTSKQNASDKKALKKKKETSITAESPREEVVSGKNKLKDDKGADAKESVPTPAVRKPCTWLKLDRLDPQVGSKSSAWSSKQGKEAKFTSQIRTVNDNKRKRKEKCEGIGDSDLDFSEKHIDLYPDNKGKGIVNDRHEDMNKRDDESGKTLGGLIFMCNAKTKPDCFNYQVMGVPANKKEVVTTIEPGLKLFLYDYDLKVLYGIFDASSTGGMKLEPAAFGGAFPAQVRFTVIKECFPLPESMFKKAIKDSYDERTRKFKTELTVKQVKDLVKLFHPAPRLNPHSRTVGQEGYPISGPVQAAALLSEEALTAQKYPNNYGFTDTGRKSIPLHPENQFPDYHVFPNAVHRQDPLFLTEQEYRNNGLRHGQGHRLLPTTTGDEVNHTQEPKILDQELKQLLRNPASSGVDSGVQHREFNPPDPRFLSEKEYRTYGLRAPHQTLNTASPKMTTNEIVEDPGQRSFDPYDDRTTALVNRYLTLPRATAVPAETYPLAGKEPYVNEMNRTSDINMNPRRAIPNGKGAFASYTLGEQSDFNQRPYSLNSGEPSEFNQGFRVQRETELTPAPVSQRYSFTGPSLSQQR